MCFNVLCFITDVLVFFNLTHNSFINVLPFMALLFGLPVKVICVSLLYGMPKNGIEWVPSLLHRVQPTIQPERQLGEETVELTPMNPTSYYAEA